MCNSLSTCWSHDWWKSKESFLCLCESKKRISGTEQQQQFVLACPKNCLKKNFGTPVIIWLLCHHHPYRLRATACSYCTTTSHSFYRYWATADQNKTANSLPYNRVRLWTNETGEDCVTSESELIILRELVSYLIWYLLLYCCWCLSVAMTSCANATRQVNERQRQQQLGIISAGPRPYARRPSPANSNNNTPNAGIYLLRTRTRTHTHTSDDTHDAISESWASVCVVFLIEPRRESVKNGRRGAGSWLRWRWPTYTIYLYCAAAVIIVIVRRRAGLQCIARHHNVKAFPRYHKIKMTDDRSDDCVRALYNNRPTSWAHWIIDGWMDWVVFLPGELIFCTIRYDTRCHAIIPRCTFQSSRADRPTDRTTVVSCTAILGTKRSCMMLMSVS